MKNVLIVLPNDTLGGAEQYLKMVASRFLSQGYHVHVYFFKKESTKAWKEIKTDRLHLYYTNSTREGYGIFKTLKNILNKKYIYFEYAFTSHVHCSSFVGILYQLKLLKINYFIARESTSIFKRFTGLKLFIYRVMYYLGYLPIDLLVCQTDYMKEQLIESLSWLDKKIKVKTIPNPINWDDIMLKALSEIDSPSDFPYIVSAGRLIPEKGFDILIKTFHRLSHSCPDLKLVILGEGKDRQFLINIVEELEIEDKVIFSGFKPNIYPYLKNAKLCVVSSRIEGFPNVLLQMMSQNTKVVSTRCAGGIEDINGVFTCETDNVDDLYNTMTKCLNTDTKPYRTLFDIELRKRDITEFMKSVENYLNE